MEQIARERSAGRAEKAPRDSVTVHVSRTVNDPRRENIARPPAPEKSVKAKVAEIQQRWQAQKDKERGR
jgi:hypothetical protein